MTKSEYKQELFKRFAKSEKYYYTFGDIINEVVNWVEDIEPFKFDYEEDLNKSKDIIYYEWEL